MTKKQWFNALEAVAQAQEANARAMRLLLAMEYDEPSNVVRDADKTGPRTPFKGALAVENLRKLFADATSEVERTRIRTVVWQLVDEGSITEKEGRSFGPRR